MKLQELLSLRQLLRAGGAGSGCHGDNCGRPKNDGMSTATYKEGKHVLDNGDKLPDHLSKLRIPPAWTNVRVNTDPKADLYAKGVDAKGRVQSIYSPKHTSNQALQKFARVQKLEQKLASIEAKNEKNIGHSDKAKADAADVVKLILHTGIRPGSEKETGAEKKAYGATTLQGKHVTTDEQGNTMLHFTGKKGVDLKIPINDAGVANMLHQRASEAGADGKLFSNTSAEHLRQYTHSVGGTAIKPKDFRTLLANRVAKEEVQKMATPKGPKEYKAALKSVATKVATKLGNTPAIALASYINPHVFNSWSGASAMHAEAVSPSVIQGTPINNEDIYVANRVGGFRRIV